ncbi:MAG: hypothetical protein HC853_17105 [Anaerolineae bacterium]|nr:hypothetical protein [Anaerolineae bacterium]
MTSLRRRIKQTGVTLIELLVAMTLGALVIGTVVALYTNTSSARAQSQALAEMNEDGLYALRILGQQLRLAGFNPVQPGRLTASPSNEPLRNPAPWGTSTLPIFACSSGFANAENTATFTGISISALTCSTTNTTSHAIAVTYEADIYNTEPTAAPALPTDCTGSSLPMQTTMTVPGRPHNYYYVENRFYVKNNSLFALAMAEERCMRRPRNP